MTLLPDPGAGARPPWDAEEAYLASDADGRARIRAQHDEGVRTAGGAGLEYGATWAGAACGLVTSVRPAAAIVASVLDEAVATLARGGDLVAG